MIARGLREGGGLGLVLAAVFAIAGCGPSLTTSGDGGDAAIEGAYVGQPFAAAVVSFTPGEGAGHGSEGFPGVVLGPPKGKGTAAGNTNDVLSLGRGGVIVLELGVDVMDGDGVDLLVFENPFYFGSQTFSEPGAVSVSLDGDQWATFPCDPAAASPNGCAGYEPVLPADDATDPDEVGGDRFDLADVGLARARFVRIVDVAAALVGDDGTGGFDLDAVAVVNAAAD